MKRTTSRTSAGNSTSAFVVTSPASSTMPVVVSVSHATRDIGSCSSIASSTASEIWSHILSGWPIDTDSDVNSWRAMQETPGSGPSRLGADRGRPGEAPEDRAL